MSPTDGVSAMPARALRFLCLLLLVLAPVSCCERSPDPASQGAHGRAPLQLAVREQGAGFVFSTDAVFFARIPGRMAAALPEKDEAKALAAFNAAYEAVERVNRWASVYRPDSIVSAFNNARADETVNVPQELISVLQVSRLANEVSGGAFDPTVKPLIDVFRTARKEARLPRPDEIARARPLVGFHHLVIDPAGSLSKDLDGVAIDLGGIAKGCGVDMAVQALRSSGIEAGLVEIGGDMRVFGSRPDGTPWRVGVANPLSPRSLAAFVDIPPRDGPADLALVTSGDYEQVYEVDGRKYTHIFDPQTGEPLPCRGAGVSVAAPNATLADALATAFFVVGRERSFEIARNTGAAVLWVEANSDGSLSFATNDAFKGLLAPGGVGHATDVNKKGDAR